MVSNDKRLATPANVFGAGLLRDSEAVLEFIGAMPCKVGEVCGEAVALTAQQAVGLGNCDLRIASCAMHVMCKHCVRQCS